MCVTLLAALCARPARSEDSGTTRYYIDVRYGESNPISKAHDVAGFSLGLNLNRYLGFELALDRFQLRLFNSGGARVSDFGVNGFTPQIRLRYPLWNDRFVPYVVGGTGVARTNVNDTTEPVTWLDGNKDARAVTTAGVGIEYFLRDNIAFGIEGKYFLLGKGRFTVREEENSISLNAGTLTFGFRVFYPELHAPAPRATAAGSPRWRLFGAVRFGGALAAEAHLFPGMTTEPADSILGSNFTTVFGGALGIDYGRYLGLEASFENYGRTVSMNDRGVIGKYAVFPILLQARVRYPLLDGRLEPYLLAGVGAEVAEPDKPNDNARGVPWSRSACAAGDVGAGLQYFVMSDVALTAETKYVLSGGHEQWAGADDAGNTNSLLLTVGLRLYLLDL